jgi:alpha-glucoside transport system substrate-binding protein
MRSSSLVRALVVAMAAIFTAVACGTSSTQNAGTVHVIAQWSGGEQANFMAVMKPFLDSTGIKMAYTATRDEDAILRSNVAAGNPPDLAAAPSPQLLTQFAQQGKVIALNSAVDMTALQANYAKSWIDLGEPLHDGKLYQVFSWADLKGLIWYDPANFQAKGYNVPNSWDSLLALQTQIKSTGTTPWCMAIASTGADGWPGSDWIKEIVLSQSGPAIYDNWVAGKQKWSSPEIRNAFQTWGSVLGTNDSNVYGGQQYILSTQFGAVGTPMFASPPKCYMLNQATFIPSFFVKADPSLKPVTNFNFFALPDISPQFAGAHVVAADSWSMFKDTPQARKMIQYLTTADAQTIWVKLGGKLSPNKQTSLDAYPDPLAKEEAQLLASTQIAKYDATDNMPVAMKDACWQAVLAYVADQNKLDTILQALDKVQSTAYTSS